MRANVTEKKETEWFLYKAALKLLALKSPVTIYESKCRHLPWIAGTDGWRCDLPAICQNQGGPRVFCGQEMVIWIEGPSITCEPTCLPSTSSRDVRVPVVEECKVVGRVLVSTGFLSFTLVTLGAGGTSPGAGEKKRTGVDHWSPKSLHMVRE